MSTSASVRKVFIVSDQYNNRGKDRALSIRLGCEPAFTVEASKSGGRAGRCFIVDGQQNRGEMITLRHAIEPAFTVTASASKRPARAWLSNGCVVAMTTRGLARLQTLPDSYELSGAARLDCTAIGNGVPCEFMREIVKANSQMAAG